MFPVIFEAGDFHIPSYGFFIAAGYVAALLTVRSVARQLGLDPARFSDLTFIALVSGLFGGRILFVVVNLKHFQQYPGEIFSFWGGGLVFYGGFITAAAACMLYLRWKEMPLARSLDVLVPGLALGHGIGRIGCFAAGCCHGNYCPFPWGIKMDSPLVSAELRGIPLHPTQLYESGGLIALSVALLWLLKRKTEPGFAALVYVAGYSGLRFGVEFFRGDDARGNLFGSWASTSQVIAAALFLIAAALFARGFRSNN